MRFGVQLKPCPQPCGDRIFIGTADVQRFFELTLDMDAPAGRIADRQFYDWSEHAGTEKKKCGRERSPETHFGMVQKL